MKSKSSPPIDPLGDIKFGIRSGCSRFFNLSSNPNINLLDFWEWSASNLLVNTTRGVLAEFLVASSLGLTEEPRNNWDSYDIKLECGVKIEVKSAAKYQAWEQKGPSRIEFGISKPKKGDRPAHIYVFCVFNEIEPLNLDRWDFYVLLTEHINKRCGTQGKISLTSLKRIFQSKLNECRFDGLKSTVEIAASNVPLCRVN